MKQIPLRDVPQDKGPRSIRVGGLRFYYKDVLDAFIQGTEPEEG